MISLTALGSILMAASTALSGSVPHALEAPGFRPPGRSPLYAAIHCQVPALVGVNVNEGGWSPDAVTFTVLLLTRLPVGLPLESQPVPV